MSITNHTLSLHFDLLTLSGYAWHANPSVPNNLLQHPIVELEALQDRWIYSALAYMYSRAYGLLRKG